MVTNRADPLDAAPAWPKVISRPELLIAATYLIAAGAWVVLSDQAVKSKLPESSLSAQTLKGLNFVATTAVLLFFVLRRAYRGWRKAERRNRELTAEVNECLRLLCARTESAREEERTRISRELHDQLGQALTGLKMDLRWVEGRLEQAGQPALNPVTDRLVEAGEQVQAMIAEVQSIATDLRPDALDHLGLVEAMEQEAKRFTDRTGVPCSIDARGGFKSVPPEISTTAYRILQEAMTNVARHAEATRVKLTCVADESALTMTIADNGKGMPATGDWGRKALGMLGMRERAELCGGQFRVCCPEGGGTEITAVLPWKKD